MIFQLLRRFALTISVVAAPVLAQAGERGVAVAIGNGPYAVVPAPANPPDEAINAAISPAFSVNGVLSGEFRRAALQFPTRHAQLDLYPYDGEWQGEMRTTFSSAPCGMQYRLKMSVTQGAATGSAARAGERFTLYGKISADGKLSWTVTGGRGGATGEGVVDGNTAMGDWEDDTGQCAGTFSIEKTS